MRYQITEYRPVIVFQTDDKAAADNFWKNEELEEVEASRGGQYLDTETGLMVDEWV